MSNDKKDLKYFKKKLVKIPKYPRKVPPYRIHWNWDISYKCNFKCSYCQVMKRDEEFIYHNLNADEWTDIFERIFDLYWSTHFRFSGGEPTAYPGFIDFLGKLMEKNTADITTNLSFDFNEFLDKVPPDKGLSISSSFHPEYQDMEDFLKKIKYLHKHGFPSTISYVGYPPHLDKISEYKKMVEDERIYFKVIPFSGEYKGKFYPDSYNQEEKKLLEILAHNSEDEHLNEMNTAWYEHHVEKKEEPESRVKKGKKCHMGYMYAIIHPDFKVTRCCAGYHGEDSGFMGLITDENFRMLEEPECCEVDYECPCFKAMIVGEDEEKWESLWESLDHPVYKADYMKEYVQWLDENENIGKKGEKQ